MFGRARGTFPFPGLEAEPFALAIDQADGLARFRQPFEVSEAPGKITLR